MTNEDYRRSRGTDRPFTATKRETKKAWYAINKEKIKARRKRDKAIKDMRRKKEGYTDPGFYEDDQEDDL